MAGPILNDGSKVVLKGKSPRFNRRCKVIGTRNQTWTFTLIEPTEMPREFRGEWTNNPKNCEGWNKFTVSARNLRGHEWGCDFISVKRTEPMQWEGMVGTVAILAYCGAESVTYTEKGLWTLDGTRLTMISTTSTAKRVPKKPPMKPPATNREAKRQSISPDNA